MRRTRVVLFAVALPALALAATCTLTPNVPNARVLCDPAKPRCPGGFTCEPIMQASVPIGVCCRSAGCSTVLTPEQVSEIVDAGVSSGLLDGGAHDAPADHPGDGGGPVCGNGKLELNETCDPPSSCPTSCPRVGCEIQALQGSAAACNARCVKTSDQTTCAGGDQCCPSSCTVANDSDCACVCGNGTVESACGEKCDPLASCPTACPPVGCMLRRLANPGSCQAECVNDVMQTACVNGDGCCPAACNAANDSDCTTMCGNGTIETGETCDPPSSCPTACPPIGCTRRKLMGSAAACTAACVDDGMQTTCASGDSCCPPGCNVGNDADCSVVCGNGVVESGETCDPLATCPTSCPNASCMLKKLANPGTCQAQCVANGTQTDCVGGDGCCPPGCNATNDNDCQPACGNGAVETGETCDPPSSCPTACPPIGCQRQKLTGSATTCTARCVNDTVQTACVAGDSCCPTGCNSGSDSDCQCVCGNGTVESACQETCDPIATCPTACPAVGCQLRRLVNQGTCQARCVNDVMNTMCVGGDGCCPPNCNATNDGDCQPTCGNGVVEAGETCDPPGSCPTTCPWSGCNRKKLVGMAAACTAACVDDGTQTACANGDGCCPTACNANTDNNCSPACGNGVVEMGEVCDGNCPQSCPNVGCQKRMLQGSASACTAQCVNTTTITTCGNGDSCCPSGCNTTNDSDCSCVCGNGVVETACGEKCDPLASCPTSCPPVGCQLRALQGTGCGAECVNTTTVTSCTSGDGCCPSGCNANTDNNCQPMCGNGVIEPNETCDPPSTSCQPQFDMCVGDKNTIRTRSGSVANCTFQCTSAIRTCSATSDGFCPSSCTPCVGSCGAGQDIDCKLSNGDACTNDTQCPGSCIDGHCCASTCAPCFQCTGANGACVPVAQYSEDIVPAGACTGVNSCDGMGNCKLDNGQGCSSGGPQICVSGFCADNVCCATACAGGCDTCTGAGGTCVPVGAGAAGSPSCSPFLCNGTSGSCPSSCTTTSQCAAGFYCVAGICQKKLNGNTCGANGECASGMCVDSTCCDSLCTGVCQYCGNTQGMCRAAALGSSPRRAPDGSLSCGGYACDGTHTGCPPASCSSNDNCLNGYTCQQGSCAVCAMNGASCSQAQAFRCCSGVCFNFQCADSTM